MLFRRWAALASASALIVMPLAVLGASHSTAADPPPPVYVGADGILYPAAPVVVTGNDGYLYIGEDFDTYCYDRQAFPRAMGKLAKVARLIEKSGRRAIFTVAPNKSSVMTGDVSSFPHGACAKKGVAKQAKVLDTFDDPHYLNVRAALARDKRQVYWRTDAHWSTVGASDYAKALAAKLSPRLAAEQRYKITSRTELGDLMEYLLIPQPETAPAALPNNGVTVRTAPGSDGFDPVSAVSFDHSWISSPRKKTFKGHTLLVGDSFTYVGLEPLRPLFSHGRFLWISFGTLDRIIQGITQADTVVIAVVQRFVARSPLITRQFYRQLRAALHR